MTLHALELDLLETISNQMDCARRDWIDELISVGVDPTTLQAYALSASDIINIIGTRMLGSTVDMATGGVESTWDTPDNHEDNQTNLLCQQLLSNLAPLDDSGIDNLSGTLVIKDLVLNIKNDRVYILYEHIPE